MDMMSNIASASMTLSAAQTQQQYSLAVTKKVMDTQEIALESILEMMPQQNTLVKGTYIDIYA